MSQSGKRLNSLRPAASPLSGPCSNGSGPAPSRCREAGHQSSKRQNSLKTETGLKLCWEEVSRAKFRCGLGSIIDGDGIAGERWNDWQMRLLSIEEEMIVELKKQGKWDV